MCYPKNMMKIVKPRITKCIESSFDECLKNKSFNNVKINCESNSKLIIKDIDFDSCIFENIDFTNIELIGVNLIDCNFKS